MVALDISPAVLVNGKAVYVLSAHEQKHAGLVEKALETSKVAIFLEQKPELSPFVDFKAYFKGTIHYKIHFYNSF